MPKSSPAPSDALHIWRFAGGRFDERTLEIERNGQVIALERKPNDVLRYLLRHAGEVVTKNELLDQVWPGRYVTEGVLSKHIARLRRALGDDSQQTIRTVSGVGYRLVADVERTPVPDNRDFPALELLAGQRLEQRPHWRLEQRLGRNRSIEVWRLRQVDTGEQRVFKLCTAEDDLVSLKREITVSRLLREGGDGVSAHHVPIIDWNLEHSPYWIELPWLADGSLVDWWQARAGKWTLAERIELAAEIAQALSQAHALGVLHKDLKPANILIDRDSSNRTRPKLADFGSARLLDPERLPELGITQLGFTQPASGWSDTGGTPLYLAPEVIRGGPFTLASDLYAFGIILYQLVIDDLLQPIAAGWERTVGDELLCQDIAALIEGDPARRLADAGAVAHRLHHLDARRAEREQEQRQRDEAQQALHIAERARRRRNVAFAFAAVLLLALIVTGALFLRAQAALELARSEAIRADRQAARAAAVSDFLTEDLLAMADPFVSGEQDLSIRRAIEFARANIGKRFAGQADIEAAVRLRIAMMLHTLGQPDTSRAELDVVMEHAVDTHVRAQALVGLMSLGLGQNRHDEVLHLADQLLEIASDDPEREIEALAYKALVAMRTGDYAQAEADLTHLMPRARDRLGDAHKVTQVIRRALATLMQVAGNYASAATLVRESLAQLEQRYGPEHITTQVERPTLAYILSLSDQHDDAVAMMRHVYPAIAATLGAESERSMQTLAYYAIVLRNAGHLQEATEQYEKLVHYRLDASGELSPHTRAAMNSYGRCLHGLGRYDEALLWSQRAYEADRAVHGDEHPETLISAYAVGESLRATSRLSEALALQRDLLEKAIAAHPDGHFRIGLYQGALALTLERIGALDEALSFATQAEQILAAALGSGHSYTIQVHETRTRLSTR